MTNCKGTWIVESKVPSTPEIRYRTSPTSPWVSVVGGTTYTVTPIYGTNRTRSYILKIKQKWSMGSFTTNTGGTVLWSREAVFYSQPITGEILGVQLQSNNVTNNTISVYSSFRWFGLGRVDVRRIGSSGVTSIAAAVGINANVFGDYVRNSNTHTDDVDPVGSAKDVNSFGVLSGSFQAVQNASGALGGYARVRTDSAELKQILPAVANQPPDGYRLVVRDCNNSVLLDTTGSSEPEIEVIASMMPDDWSRDEVSAPLRASLGYPIEGYYLVLDKATQNQVKVRLRHESDNAFEWLVKLFEQHPCADGRPEVKITCSDAEECPEGTCEVVCNGHRCCYDKDGISVKTLPLS